MAKERQSNFELCRLASILLVMLVHTTSQSLGKDMNLATRLLEGFSVVGVNVFVLLTGYFSATPKKTNLLNLAFICFFWMIVKVICRYECGEPIGIRQLFFVTSSNWFIASYIGLLFFAPILNLFSNSVGKKTLLGGAILLLLFEMWFDWLPPYPGVKIGANNGYSVLSFIVLYLLARAIKLFGIPEWFMKLSPIIYVFCSIILGVASQFLAILGHDAPGLCYSYINPIVIISSVAFLMMFERLKIQSIFINHIAKSTLAVLLGHSAIFFLYTKQFKYIYDNFSGFQLVCYWTFAIVIVFCSSVMIDQLRLIMYKPIERFLKAKIKNNFLFEVSTSTTVINN